jgi:hypothetical protein
MPEGNEFRSVHEMWDIVEFRDETNASGLLADDEAAPDDDLLCDGLCDIEYGHDDVTMCDRMM